MKKFTVMVVSLLSMLFVSQVWGANFNVYFYPHIIGPQENLVDGPHGIKIDIFEETALVWVDLEPTQKFPHETAYILISKNNTRVEKGYRWPVLNKKKILAGERNKYAILSPFSVPYDSGSGIPDERIDIYIYPYELDSKNLLTDGLFEKLFLIHDNCLLIWVDLLPIAFFTHPTAYILISKDNIQVEKGHWWPMLNGKKILYGQKNKTGIICPFKVTY